MYNYQVDCLGKCSRVQNCDQVVANVPKNGNLSTRISKLVASMRLDIMFSLQYLEQAFRRKGFGHYFLFSGDQKLLSSRHMATLAN